ncbi:MAG: helix-turn-helix domain-containing protein [Rhodothermales bacterium]|nr:helix-turn-helix domain-containing protein [Rhodothermales bacterium]
MIDIPEITDEQFERRQSGPTPGSVGSWKFFIREDIVAARHFIGLSQTDLARAMEISVHTLRNWEQGRRKPDGPALALLKIAARDRRIIRENPVSAA